MTQSNVTYCQAQSGGGIYDSGSVYVQQSSIDDDYAKASGGGIYIAPNGSVNLSNQTDVWNDVAQTGNGGGICNIVGTVVSYGDSFQWDYAEGNGAYGGAIFNDSVGSSLAVSSTWDLFRFDFAQFGGALGNVFGTVQVSNGYLLYNDGVQGGGAVYSSGGALTSTNNWYD